METDVEYSVCSYRRIPGDKCQGGVLDQFISTQTAPCSGNPGPKSKHKTPLPPVCNPSMS